MLAKHNEVKRSKVVMAYWMKKGWMRFVSVKKGSYHAVPNYVKELFQERETLMNLIIDMETKLEEGEVNETPEVKKQLKDWEEIYQTIDLELNLLHEGHTFADLYQVGERYRGFEVFCYEDDVVPKGFYCKVEQLDMEFENTEDYATYLYVDTPLELISLFQIADEILGLDTEMLDPAIEITLLSEDEVKSCNQEFIPISTHC